MNPSFRILACLLLASITMSPALRADGGNADNAIANGLAWLDNQQNADGSFDLRGQRFATTGLSLLAFLDTGNTSDGGKYAATVRRATEFLLRQAPADRYFGQVDNSQMRGQAIVTLALCRAYGVEPDESTRARIRVILREAVAILLEAQAAKKSPDYDGGWGEKRVSAESDLVVSQWSLAAIRAASEIGLGVTRENLDRAASYIERSTRAGIEHPATQSGKVVPEASYFERQAHEEASKLISARLVASQLPDGGWPGGTSATAVSVLTLSISLQLPPSAGR